MNRFVVMGVESVGGQGEPGGVYEGGGGTAPAELRLVRRGSIEWLRTVEDEYPAKSLLYGPGSYSPHPSSDFTVAGISPSMKRANQMFTIDLPLAKFGPHVGAMRVEGMDSAFGAKEDDLPASKACRSNLTLSDIGARRYQIPSCQIVGHPPGQALFSKISSFCDVQGKTR